MKSLETIDIKTWDGPISKDIQDKAIQALEGGKVLFFPSLSFPLHNNEYQFLSEETVDPKAKNISFDIHKDRLGGTSCTGDEADQLKEMIKRYALVSYKFLGKLIPYYNSHLIQAKTSMRPVEIFGRKSSYRKDDTLLHVDSFPSNPTHGQRILRFFTNINPDGKPRVWRIGEPFPDVVKKIAPKTSHPLFGVSHLLYWLKITKEIRSPFDHYMLQIHDTMKGDSHYQKTVPQEEVRFPAGSSWMVYTDQVSHAAMSGKDVFEQTCHLPPYALKNESTAPLKVLEKFFNKSLI